MNAPMAIDLDFINDSVDSGEAYEDSKSNNKRSRISLEQVCLEGGNDSPNNELSNSLNPINRSLGYPNLNQTEVMDRLNQMSAQLNSLINPSVSQRVASPVVKPLTNKIALNNFMDSITGTVKTNSRSEINRLIRILPKFKDGDAENVSSWVQNTKLGLSLSDCSEAEMFKIVLFKVEGYPREILENMHGINTVENIFETLQNIYGQDQRSILSNIKQLTDESVKVFSSRLKINLSLLGIQPNVDNQSSLIRLDYFLKGLNDSISSRVKSLLPESYEVAERYALQIEAQNKQIKSN